MSDEYANTGFKGSLANDSVDSIIGDADKRDTKSTPAGDYATGNYPPAGDTTSSGGYRQRPADSGLLDQSTTGSAHIEDAKQGRDEGAREQMNPYSGSSLDTRQQAGEALASRYVDARGKRLEGGGPADNDDDVGA